MTYTSPKMKSLEDLTEDDLFRKLVAGVRGRPNYGFILSYYRWLAGWTAAQLACYYSQALGNEEITASWIYIMENQNKVPADEKRRAILARLLGIPPFLFGLPVTDNALRALPADVLVWFSEEKIDVVEYRTTLRKYCNSFSSGDLYQLVSELQGRIKKLADHVNYTASPEKKQMQRLLCEYLALLAVVLHSHQYFDLVIAALSKAICVAEINVASNKTLYDIWAYALRQRAVAHIDRGELTAGLVDFAAAKKDFELAAADIDAARKLESHLSPLRNGLVLGTAGRAYGHIARDEDEYSAALALVDQSSQAIGKEGDDSTIPAKMDQARYHLSKGNALISSPLPSLRSPSMAITELEEALKWIPVSFTDRQMQANLLFAEAHYFEGQFPKVKQYYPDEHFAMSLAHAEAALDIARTTDSPFYLVRLENLYKRLRESRFGKDDGVVDLGVEILKVQRPELFN